MIRTEQRRHSEKKHFARHWTEEEVEVMAEVVMATMEGEVQEGLHPDPETTMGSTTTRQRRWSSHHTMQERLKKQHMTQ